MSDQLPEGVDVQTVLNHGVVIQISAQTINNSADYMRADEGSPEEAAAEQVLSEAIEQIVGMGPDVSGNVILALASLIIEVAEPEDVQAWFNHQQEKIMEALG